MMKGITDEELKNSIILMQITIHADIIEGLVTELNPIRNINNFDHVNNLERLKKVCKETRKKYEDLDPESREKLGDVIEVIKTELIKIFKGEKEV